MTEVAFGKAFAEYSDEDFKNRRAYGRLIFALAVVVEIAAMSLGVYIAYTQSYSAWNVIPLEERDNVALLRVIGAGGPFLIIAIIEPTKLALAYVLYNAKVASIRFVFLLAILAVTFVTFETMFNGLLQQNILVSSEAEITRNERQANLEEMAKNRNEYTLAQTNTPEKIRGRFKSQIDDLNFSRAQEVKRIREEFSVRIEALKDDISTVRQNGDGLKETLRDRIEQNQTQAREIRRARDVEIENIKSRYSQSIRGVEQELKDLRENKVRLLDGLGIFQGGQRTQINSEFLKNEAELKLTISDLRSKQDSDMQSAVKAFEQDLNRNREALAEANQELLESERKGSLANRSAVDEKQAEITDLELKRDQASKEVIVDYDQRVSDIVRERETVLTDYGSVNTKLKQYDDEYAVLAEREKDLKFQYRTQISRIQIYQISKTACGWFENWCFGSSNDESQTTSTELETLKFDVANLPEEKIETVKGLWFGSIAFIIAVMGTFLAYGSYVLNDKQNFEYKSRRAFSRIMFRLVIRFANLMWRARDFFREAGVRTGDGIKSLFLTLSEAITNLVKLVQFIVYETLKIIAGPFRGLQKLLADWRRSIRKPQIRYIERDIEIPVVKEVPVEVFVEKIVHKEVQVEVPVEKIVFKEVPREIIRKEIVYVPLYSTNEGQVPLDPEFLRSKADRDDFAASNSDSVTKDTEDNKNE
jgi:hypothetical protein